MDKHSVSEYLNEYINSFNTKYQSGGLVGGNISADVQGLITRGDFKGVIEYYFTGTGVADEILDLRLKAGPSTNIDATGAFLSIRDDFIQNQVAIVTAMLAKINTVRSAAGAGTGTGAAPGGFLSDFFNSIYGGSSGQSGGMTGGVLPNIAALPTSILPTTPVRDLFSGPFAIAAHLVGAGPGTGTGPTPAPTVAPTVAPTPICDLIDLIRQYIILPDTATAAIKNPIKNQISLNCLKEKYRFINSDPTLLANRRNQFRDAILAIPGETKIQVSNLMAVLIRRYAESETTFVNAASPTADEEQYRLFISNTRGYLLRKYNA
jgi:hypothetical protein